MSRMEAQPALARLNRRLLLLRAAATSVGMMGVLAAACAPPSPAAATVAPAVPTGAPATQAPASAATSGPAATAAQPGPTSAAAATRPANASAAPTGRVVYGIASLPPSLDPTTSQNIPWIIPWLAVWDQLLTVNRGTGALEPRLAESWTQSAANAFDFKLQRGVKFSNGRELVADDVKFSIERLMGMPANIAGRAAVVELSHLEVIDPYTVRVFTKSPSILIPYYVQPVFILPAAEVKAAGSDDAFFAKPIGSGPFLVKEFGKESFIDLTASPSSWRKPRLAELRFQSLPDTGARIAALQAGQADLIENVPPDQLSRLESAGFKTTWVPLGTNYGLELHGPADTPHANVDVRRALAHAIDWKTIVDEVMLGYGKVGNGLIGGEGAQGWASDAVKYPYDPAQAKQLLASAGFPNGFKTKMNSSTVLVNKAPDLAQAVVSYLKEVGVDVDLSLVDGATNLTLFTKTYAEGRPPMFVFGETFALRMDVGQLLDFYDDKNSIHKFNWNNDQFNSLWRSSQVESDPQKRVDLMLQANRLILDHAICIAAFQPPAIDVSTAKMSGIKIDAHGIVRVEELVKTA